MKFRTEIDIAPLGVKIGYGNRILALGSCFAEHIAGTARRTRFRIVTNPTGILFNPLSIAAALRSYADEAPRTAFRAGLRRRTVVPLRVPRLSLGRVARRGAGCDERRPQGRRPKPCAVPTGYC